MIRRIVFLTLTFAILLIGFIQHFLTVQAQDKQNNGKAAVPTSTTNNVDCDTSPIAELNEGIQLRFKTIDGSLNFGIRRALPATRNYHLRRNYLLTFIPNTVQEILAVNQLEEEGWQAGFYVVGRSILEQKPNKELWDNAKNEYYARKPINNPVRITPYIKEEDFPSA